MQEAGDEGEGDRLVKARWKKMRWKRMDKKRKRERRDRYQNLRCVHVHLCSILCVYAYVHLWQQLNDGHDVETCIGFAELLRHIENGCTAEASMITNIMAPYS